MCHAWAGRRTRRCSMRSRTRSARARRRRRPSPHCWHAPTHQSPLRRFAAPPSNSCALGCAAAALTGCVAPGPNDLPRQVRHGAAVGGQLRQIARLGWPARRRPHCARGWAEWPHLRRDSRTSECTVLTMTGIRRIDIGPWVEILLDFPPEATIEELAFECREWQRGR
jgi:hypothetical protein